MGSLGARAIRSFLVLCMALQLLGGAGPLSASSPSEPGQIAGCMGAQPDEANDMPKRCTDGHPCNSKMLECQAHSCTAALIACLDYALLRRFGERTVHPDEPFRQFLLPQAFRPPVSAST